jgi:hypothetical protein
LLFLLHCENGDFSILRKDISLIFSSQYSMLSDKFHDCCVIPKSPAWGIYGLVLSVLKFTSVQMFAFLESQLV